MRDDAVLRRALPLGRGLGRCNSGVRAFLRIRAIQMNVYLLAYLLTYLTNAY